MIQGDFIISEILIFRQMINYVKTFNILSKFQSVHGSQVRDRLWRKRDKGRKKKGY